jgi:hypothetical protein
LLSSYSVAAQNPFKDLYHILYESEDQQEIATLFGSGVQHNGGYGSPEFKFFPTANNALAAWVGGRGG